MEIVFTFDCNDPRELFNIKVIPPQPKIRSNGVSKILESLSRPGEFLILLESPLLIYPAKLCITIVSSFSWVFTVVPKEIKVNAFGFFFGLFGGGGRRGGGEGGAGWG